MVLSMALFAAQAPAPPTAPPAAERQGPVAFRRLWSVPLTGSPGATPAFTDEIGFFSLRDRLAAHSLRDGSPVWSRPRTIDLAPATGDGLVFVVEERALVALRQADGGIAWTQAVDDTPSVPLAWDNGWLVAATSRGAVLAMRGSDGAVIWRREIGAAATARPTLAADRVYVPVQDGRIVALRVLTGEPAWERRIGGRPQEISVVDDRVYVGSTDNYLYCLKADAGVIDWRWSTGGDVIGGMVADERSVYFVSLDNVLRALDRRSGNQRWKRALPFRPRGGPLRAGDELIVSGIAPPLRAYAMRDGRPTGEIAADGELASPPFVVPETEPPLVIAVTLSHEGGARLTSFSRVSVPEPAETTIPDPAALPPSEPPAPLEPPRPGG